MRKLMLMVAVGGFAGSATAQDDSMPENPLPEFVPRDLALDEDLEEDILEWVQARADADEFSGVVTLVRDGIVLVEEAYGFAEKAHRIPNTLDTRFRVGSITKSFTKVAVAKLIELGKLHRESTLADLLPDYPRLDIAGDITVEQLVSHRSGLGGMNYGAYLESYMPSIRRPMDYIELFADEPLLFAPGTREEYSNAGYIVLGAVLEAAGGRPWEELVEEYVFEAAGMVSSCFVDLDRPHVPVATGYWRCDPDQPDIWCTNYWRLELVATSGGGNYSTSQDLIAFDQAMREGALLGPEANYWYFFDRWPDPSENIIPEFWPAQAIAGGAEGVSAVVVSNSEMALSVVGNLGGDSAEYVAIALAEGLEMFE